MMTEDIALLELYRAVCAGDVGDGRPVEIPGGSARPVKTRVGKEPTGFFQNVPLNVKVSDCVVFGLYFKFCVQPPDSETVEETQANPMNASNASILKF
jgi:hypothetical protein